jgi:hypothetical protein
MTVSAVAACAGNARSQDCTGGVDSGAQQRFTRKQDSAFVRRAAGLRSSSVDRVAEVLRAARCRHSRALNRGLLNGARRPQALAQPPAVDRVTADRRNGVRRSGPVGR